MSEKENGLDQKRLSFAAGITVTLIVTTFSIAQLISGSAKLSFLYNSNGAWNKFLPLSLSGLVFLASIAVLFSCYMVLNALRLCSSNLTPNKLPKALNFLWNLSMFLLVVFLLALILLGLSFGVAAFDSGVSRWILFTLLAAAVTGGVSLLSSLLYRLFRRLITRSKSSWEPPVWVTVAWNVILYAAVLAFVYYALHPRSFWATSGNQFNSSIFIILVLYPLSIVQMIGPIEKYLRLDGWAETLRWWIRIPLVFGFFLVCAAFPSFTEPDGPSSNTAYVAPYFGDLQIQIESRSPHLAVLRIRPRGFLDFGTACYDTSKKRELDGCTEDSSNYNSDIDVVCFKHIKIELRSSNEGLQSEPTEAYDYSETPCVGSRTTQSLPGLAGLFALWELNEGSDSRRFIISNDSFEEEFQWWFDPTLLVPNNKPGWVWRAMVTIDSVTRSIYFPVSPGNEPASPNNPTR
jgi:hypothetical protein